MSPTLRTVLSLALGLALIAAGIFASLPSSVVVANHGTISGIVRDAGSQQPLADVCITVGPPIRCWTYTNAAGQYFIDIGALAGADGSEWELYFLKATYTTSSSTVTVNGPTDFDMTLAQNPTATPAPSAGPTQAPVQPVPPVTAPTPVPTPTPPSSVDACGTKSIQTPTKTVYLPNITKMLGGPNGWQTPFIVQNVGTASTTLEVSFYSFSTGECVWRRSGILLAPGTSFADVPNNDVQLPAGGQFSVVVKSFGSDIVSVVNEHQGSGSRAEALSYVGLDAGGTDVFLPYAAKNVSGWLTTVVMQNLGTASATATARFLPRSGGAAVTLTRTIAPGAAAFVDPSVESALASGQEYSVHITSTQPLAAVVNAHNDAPSAPAPMGFSYNGVIGTETADPYAPFVDHSVTSGVLGRSARVFIQNLTTTVRNPSLYVAPWDGTPVTTTTNTPALAQGAVWEVPASFLPAGRSSITSDTGFAVLVMMTSPIEALGYAAPTAPMRKSYLPNVTRTLGGPDGWTTPLVVQSVSATGATVRWYRFADGALVKTQTVTLAAGGAATRIDPRTVSGLTDDTQYAVVVEGTDGDLVAIVVEESLAGGDGAMIYEGFPRP